MTLQEQLRVGVEYEDEDTAHPDGPAPLIDAANKKMTKAADALDAKDARIRELEGALGELIRMDELGRHPECHAESWREWKRAAWERARAALKAEQPKPR